MRHFLSLHEEGAYSEMCSKRENEMNRFRLGITLLLLMATEAYATSQDYFEFSVYKSQGTATINRYLGSAAVVEVPSVVRAESGDKDSDGNPIYRDYTVTAVGQSAFTKNTSITQVTIPSSVTITGRSCIFTGCDNLETVIFRGSVVAIPGSMFSGCKNLKSLTIDWKDVVSIGNCAFQDCGYDFGDLNYMPNLQSIGSDAFLRVSSLTSVVLTSLTRLGPEAFAGCGNLESVTIDGYNLTLECSSWDGPFAYCPKLKTVKLGDGVVDLQYRTFRGSTNLECVEIGKGVTTFNSGFEGQKSLKTFVAKGDVRAIPYRMFYDCVSLTDLKLNWEKIEEIKAGAFQNCGYDFGDLNYLPNLKSVESSAFRGAPSLTSVELLSLTRLRPEAFAGCENLESVTIDGYNLTLECSSWDGPFAYCPKLKTVKFGDGVVDLQYRTFRGSTNLETVEIGKGVTTFNSGFEGQKNLKTFIAKGTVETLPYRMFYGCENLTTLELNWNGISNIGAGAFSGCLEIRSFEFGHLLSSIGPSAFSRCVNASSFAFHGAPPSVGTSAFYNVQEEAVGTYTAAHAAAWEAVIDDKGYWHGLKMKPSFYTVIYDANNGTGERVTSTVEWGEPTPVGDTTFIWESHYFMGWALEDVNGRSLGADDIMPEPQEGNTVTLYGKWATFKPVSADWSVGSITLKAEGIVAEKDEKVWLRCCDANAMAFEDAKWEDVDNIKPERDGQSIVVTDYGFSSRLGGIPAITYKFQIGKSPDEIRVTMFCTTRTKRGIFVGVGEFGADYKQKPAPLPSASAEAKKFCDLMKDKGKMADGYLLTNSDATYEKVNGAFADLAREVIPGDICVVYFSTHGGVVPIRDKDGNTITTTIGTLYLYNMPPKKDDPKEVGYHEALLANHIRTLDPMGKGIAVVNVISACHSGAFFDDSNEEICKGNDSWCHKENLDAINVAWITAASANASSYSYFDQFLFDYGWKDGWAAANDAETFSFQELASYTKRQYDGLFSGIVFKNEAESKQVQISNSQLLDKIVAGACKTHEKIESPSTPSNVRADQGKARDNIMIQWDACPSATEYCIFYRFGKENSYLGCWGSTSSTANFKLTKESQSGTQDYEDFLSTTQSSPALFIVKAINGAGISEASARASGWVDALRKVVFNGNGGVLSGNWAGELIEGTPPQVDASILRGSKLQSLPKATRTGFTFCGWFNSNHKATPDTVIQDDVTYVARWTNMTAEYLSSYPTVAAASGNDIATAANLTAANGCRTVGECYALGINPEDPNDDLKIVDFKVGDGNPVITLNHTADGSGVSFAPRIKTLGKADMSDSVWIDVTEKDQSAYRFFKVEVDLP